MIDLTKLRYLDGTTVEQEYLGKLFPLISNAAATEEEIFIDELEDWAERNG